MCQSQPPTPILLMLLHYPAYGHLLDRDLVLAKQAETKALRSHMLNLLRHAHVQDDVIAQCKLEAKLAQSETAVLRAALARMEEKQSSQAKLLALQGR